MKKKIQPETLDDTEGTTSNKNWNSILVKQKKENSYSSSSCYGTRMAKGKHYNIGSHIPVWTCTDNHLVPPNERPIYFPNIPYCRYGNCEKCITIIYYPTTKKTLLELMLMVSFRWNIKIVLRINALLKF